MAVTITQSTATWAHGAASTIAKKLQEGIKGITQDLASGKSAPRERVATAAIVGLRKAQVNQIMESMGRVNNIIAEATNSLQAVLQQYQSAYTVAEKVASDTQTADEISILSSTFNQLMGAADAAAKNAEFMGLKVLNTSNGTQATALANQAGAASATPNMESDVANTFAVVNAASISVNGNIFGTVQSVNVDALATSGTYKITVNVIDTSSGMTYSLVNDAESPVVSGNLTLRSSLGDGSTLVVPYNTNIGQLSNEATFETALEQLFQLNAPNLNATSFTPDIGDLNANVSIDVTGSTEGAGTYRFTQSSSDLSKVTVIAPTGKTETLTLADNTSGSTSKSYYAFGVKLTVNTSWNGNANLTGANGNRTLGVTMNTGTTGFSKTVSIGDESISLSIPDQSRTGLGLTTLTADSVTNAANARDQLEQTIKSIASLLGTVKAIGERVSATADNLQQTASVVEDVLSSIVDVDLVAKSEELAKTQLQQMQAMEAFLGTLTQRKQIMAALNRSFS